VPPHEPPDLLTCALVLAQTVPETVLLDAAAAIEREGRSVSPSTRAAVTLGIAHPEYRAAIARFIAGWCAWDATVSPAAVAWTLRMAGRAVAVQRAQQSTELVWTGPSPAGSALRRTDQALLEVINTAQQTLSVVTFAAYKVPTVAAALVHAAQRGVRIRVVIESSHASDGKIAYDALAALGSDVRRMAAVYIWPLERRPVDAAGHHGSLHVKCAVADDAVLLVSSANLTAYAFTLNMELGLLVRGGAIPGRVSAHLDRLIDQHILVALHGPL
jgi:phosphatidylserine/phosphatidylglycerophosphate/cardiolipin synthase-like enzyme